LRARSTAPASKDPSGPVEQSGWEGSVRRYRNARIELSTTDITDIDRVPLPPNLERIVRTFVHEMGAGSAR